MKWNRLIQRETGAFLITCLLRIWFGTVRTRVLNPHVYRRYLQNPETGNVVAGAWHRNAVILFYFFRDLGTRGVMISHSRDGELTARVGERLGYTPIRGSSSRGGAGALFAMARFLRESREKRICGTAVDGPRGPARKLKTGMLSLAKSSGACFIPVACSGTSLITLTTAWDRTILPRPFSKVLIDFGDPIEIPSTISEADFRSLCEAAEAELNRLTDKLDRICGYRDGSIFL
jgi:lysophospholipid acyltransferase (LPLAT)-like uncharacterized protein